MPGRQSHGGLPSKQPKSRVNNKKRSINAYAIAAQQNPENFKARQHRLGDIEGDNRPTKRVRLEVNGDNEGSASVPKQQKKNAVRSSFDEPAIDTGSDSEGNEWRMGYVDNEDDSELDSDEAFGDSDEERFEGFAFSGSSNQRKVKRDEKYAGSQGITLSGVDSSSEIQSQSGGDSPAGDTIDIAAMLDATETGDEEGAKGSKDRRGQADGDSCEEGSEAESEDSDDDDDYSSIFSMEDHDEDNPDKVSAIHNLVASLPQAGLPTPPFHRRNDGASEYGTPSNFGITTKVKLTLDDLGIPSVRDPFVKKSLKLLGSESKSDAKNKGIPRKLEVPLAKRQQDKLDRSAAYEKSKETLDRWTDTVKQNRRAEHLIFPLPDSDAASANANARLQPTSNSKPFNELEAAIQTILEESGLAATNGKDDEDKIMEFEKLEANKISIEDVKARHAQLRMARDLLFREEARAKRIKKIKSKSYRRVHRKQREKENQMNRQALIEVGIEPSEDEQELQDRRRAEERMGAKHRNSKWAKATKQAGRAAWDEDARASIIEMARQEEELKKRVEGRVFRGNGARDSESSISDSENESIADENAEQARLLRKLDSIGTSDIFTDSVPGSKLSNMKFMLKAEASRKKENDAIVEQIRKELAGEDCSDGTENEFGEVGRRVFGPGNTLSNNNQSINDIKGNEFEAPDDSSDEGAVEIRTTTQHRDTTSLTVPKKKDQSLTLRQNATQQIAISNDQSIESGGGAWSRIASQKGSHKLKHVVDVGELDISNAIILSKGAKPKKQLNVGQSTLQVDESDDEDSEGDDKMRLPYAIQDQELIKRAFAGADVVGEFEAEKRQTIEDEEEKIIDNTLPGWGSWVGDGISKKDKQQHRGRFLTKRAGIKEQDRKDAKLRNVIINEKRVKKNDKYLSSNLPHPFETRQQYERSLRLPVGLEWTTKETFQDTTKPRILMKQGIIAPMSKPLF